MAADLSQHHQPITSLFASPEGREARERCKLSDEQVEFYREHGYLAGVQVLDDRQIDQLRDELQPLTEASADVRALFYEYHSNESADPSRVLFHALGAWRAAPGFHDILWNPAYLIPAYQLLGGPVRFWHDQLFCKPAKHGGVVAWHQDYSYWIRTKPMAHLTCWIGLDDSTRDNGCVHYVPGSHNWTLLPITGLAGNMEAIREVLNPEQWEQFNHPVAVELKKGQCSFHHPLMVHGSFENRTDRPRRATVVNLMRDGVRSDSNDPPLEGVPAVPAGEKMQGQFFPLLYSGPEA